MKSLLILLVSFFLISVTNCQDSELDKKFIRLNQVGFHASDIKTAVILSTIPLESSEFFLKELSSEKKVFNGSIQEEYFSWGNFPYCVNIDFSEFSSDGKYFLEFGSEKSTILEIGENIYNHVRDSLSLFFKIQRCGPTIPLLHSTCHLYDVASVSGRNDTSAIDVTGGWHDAGDYLKFFSTAAYTTYLLLFCYEFDQVRFSYDLNQDGVPDILEEARVGLDWLLRCRIEPDLFITQVQDISDHQVGWRLPDKDTLRYSRRGYASIGKNQIGIFAAVMSLASRIWKDRFYDYDFSEILLNSAIESYKFIDQVQDVDSSESGFYQDFNFQGKAALGAVELFLSTKNDKYYYDAVRFAENAKPDYWWSWGNISALAHYKIAAFDKRFITYIKEDLIHYNRLFSESRFKEAAEYTWGTTNSLLGASLKVILYKTLTSDDKYDSLLILQRDYILGRNPWGISFIYGIGEVFSKHLHSQVGFFNDGYLPGALSSGPVKSSLITEYKIERKNFTFNYFNSDSVQYFDDYNDYLTNEPAIVSNSTALFVFGYFSSSP